MYLYYNQDIIKFIQGGWEFYSPVRRPTPNRAPFFCFISFLFILFLAATAAALLLASCLFCVAAAWEKIIRSAQFGTSTGSQLKPDWVSGWRQTKLFRQRLASFWDLLFRASKGPDLNWPFGLQLPYFSFSSLPISPWRTLRIGDYQYTVGSSIPKSFIRSLLSLLSLSLSLSLFLFDDLGYVFDPSCSW